MIRFSFPSSVFPFNYSSNAFISSLISMTINGKIVGRCRSRKKSSATLFVIFLSINSLNYVFKFFVLFSRCISLAPFSSLNESCVKYYKIVVRTWNWNCIRLKMEEMPPGDDGARMILFEVSVMMGEFQIK